MQDHSQYVLAPYKVLFFLADLAAELAGSAEWNGPPLISASACALGTNRFRDFENPRKAMAGLAGTRFQTAIGTEIKKSVESLL